MGSVAKPRCARGQSCYHVRKFDHIDEPSTVPREGDLCGHCQTEHAGGIQASESARWIPQALEAMFPGEGGRRSLWDLFELDPTGRYGRYSDRGEALTRLDTRTLKHLRGWLEEHWDEATVRYGLGRLRGLWTDVSLMGRFRGMAVPEKSLIFNHPDRTMPLEDMGYTSSGRPVDMMIPIKLLILCEQPGYMSEGDLAEAVGIPRTTLRGMLKRMEDVGFSLERKFTSDELAYVAMGGRRGRRRKLEDPS